MVSEKQFREHLLFLKAQEYCAEDFCLLESRLESKQVFPSRYVVLTCDDGNQSCMKVAEILGEYGFPATFFLTRDRCLRKPGFVRERQVRELRGMGFSLGTHGATHRKLTFLPWKTCLEELRGSKEWLEDVIGERVSYMAAPGGFVNARIVKQAQECGYSLVGTCSEWLNSTADLHLPTTLNRVNVRRRFSIRTLRHIVEGRPGFYIRRQIRAAALWLPKQLHR